jgi:hypothetical protein
VDGFFCFLVAVVDCFFVWVLAEDLACFGGLDFDVL